MLIEETNIDSVLLVRPIVRTDFRGSVSFVWNSEVWASAGLPSLMAQENHITSHQWVLRGVHVNTRSSQGKLVRCSVGRIVDVAVDLRRESRTFGHSVIRELEGESGQALWIPPRFGHGVLALSERAVFSIQASVLGRPEDERTLAWDDASTAIHWPLPDGVRPVISPRDAVGQSLDEFR
jgi:dTDP-4-dehydrorhamnose 3,5-epimerase